MRTAPRSELPPPPPGWVYLGRMRLADAPPLPPTLPLAFARPQDDGYARVLAPEVWHSPIQHLIAVMVSHPQELRERAPTSSGWPCLLAAVLVEVGRLQRLGLGAHGLLVLTEAGGWTPCPA